MREAVEAQIVVTDGEGRFAFRHALLREVLYDDLLPGERPSCTRRSRGRSSASAAMARGGVDRHRHRPPLQRRRRPAGGAEGGGRGGRGRLAPAGFGEAAALLDRAVALWPRVPDPRGGCRDRPRRGPARACARAHYSGVEDEVAVGLYERAIEEIDADRRAGARGDGAAPARDLPVVARAGRAQSRDPAARARPARRRSATSPARAQLLAQRVRFLLLQGRYREVREEAPEALEAIGLSGYEHARAGVVNRLGLALFALGEEEEAEARMRESIELAERSRIPTTSPPCISTTPTRFTARRPQPRRRSRRPTRASAKVQALLGDRAVLPGARVGSAQHRRDQLRPGRLGDRRGRDRRREREGLSGSRSRAPSCSGRSSRSAARPTRSWRARTIDDACELLRDSLEPQYIGAARLAWRPSSSGAWAASTRPARPRPEGIDRIQFCSEDGTRIALIATAGLAVEADAAVRACDVDDDEACDAARARAEFLAELASRPPPRRARARSRSPTPRRLRPNSRGRSARTTRSAGAKPPTRWAAIERPYPRARSRSGARRRPSSSARPAPPPPPRSPRRW